jgi:TatA/E family protein of Tat protein translocase
MPTVGTGEIILLLVVALLLFGPHRMPELARSLGKSVRDFKNAVSDVGEDLALPSSLDLDEEADVVSPLPDETR